MDIFDKLKKKSKEKYEQISQRAENTSRQNENINQQNNAINQYAENEVNFCTNSDGYLQVDYYNAKAQDNMTMTRLVIKGTVNVGGYNLALCNVSWYKRDDCQVLIKQDQNTKEFDIASARDYRKILTQIDVFRLQSDMDYCKMFMVELLDRKRIEGKLREGLEENPKEPCGEYIGQVGIKNGKLCKQFSPEVGKAAHDAPYMQEIRRKNKENKMRYNQEQINKYNKKIGQLQKENDELQEENKKCRKNKDLEIE